VIVFDTDVISYAMRAVPPVDLIRRLAGVDPADQATTAITVGELVYGACRSGERKDRLLEAIDSLVVPNLQVLPFDETAARTYGELRAELEQAGKSVSEPDLRIAAITISRGAVLATGNLRHFKRVPGLMVEDWLADHR
jgi:predicted nucleic acid-binding protein